MAKQFQSVTKLSKYCCQAVYTKMPAVNQLSAMLFSAPTWAETTSFSFKVSTTSVRQWASQMSGLVSDKNICWKWYYFAYITLQWEGITKRCRNFSWLLPSKGGVSSAINVFLIFFFKTKNHSLTAKTRFAHSLSFILWIYSSWGDSEHGYYMAVGGRSSLRMSFF